MPAPNRGGLAAMASVSALVVDPLHRVGIALAQPVGFRAPEVAYLFSLLSGVVAGRSLVGLSRKTPGNLLEGLVSARTWGFKSPLRHH